MIPIRVINIIGRFDTSGLYNQSVLIGGPWLRVVYHRRQITACDRFPSVGTYVMDGYTCEQRLIRVFLTLIDAPPGFYPQWLPEQHYRVFLKRKSDDDYRRLVYVRFAIFSMFYLIRRIFVHHAKFYLNFLFFGTWRSTEWTGWAMAHANMPLGGLCIMHLAHQIMWLTQVHKNIASALR